MYVLTNIKNINNKAIYLLILIIIKYNFFLNNIVIWFESDNTWEGYVHLKVFLFYY